MSQAICQKCKKPLTKKEELYVHRERLFTFHPFHVACYNESNSWIKRYTVIKNPSRQKLLVIYSLIYSVLAFWTASGMAIMLALNFVRYQDALFLMGAFIFLPGAALSIVALLSLAKHYQYWTLYERSCEEF